LNYLVKPSAFGVVIANYLVKPSIFVVVDITTTKAEDFTR
jgi:hypothetical protein